MSDDREAGLPEAAKQPDAASDPFASLYDTAVAVPPGPLLETAPFEAAIPARSGAPGVLGLERHVPVTAPRTGAVNWVALVLSVIAPPIGVLAAIAAIIIGIRFNGFAATVAKIALALGIILSLVLGVGLSVVNDADKKQAAHDAIVASSVKYCAALKSSPGLLSSADYEFPAAQDTVTDSIAAVQKYNEFWVGLVRVAPAGIKHGTQNVADTVAGILASATSSQVFDETSNATQMQPVVASSGINDWVSQYCN